MYVFIGVALFIIIGAGVLVYVLLARKGRLRALILGLCASSLCVLLWPLPIHGGFITLGEVLFKELQESLERKQETAQKRKHDQFLQNLNTRFKGELPLQQRTRVTGAWFVARTHNGAPAWFDRSSGLVWSSILTLRSDTTFPDLSQAKRLCRDHPPQGYWALPTEAEQYFFWQAQGHKVLPEKIASAVAYMVDEDLRSELPTVRLPGPADNTGRSTSRGRTLRVRCVARGEGAPLRGYIKNDIPLREWNRFQLSKSAPG